MSAILELIKTLIPFGIAFLFLWGIGRACCTPNKKPTDAPLKQKPKPKVPLDSNDDEKDGQSTLFHEKEDMFYTKKDMVESSKELKQGKGNLFDSKQELFASKQDMMTVKADFMTAKKSMIREASEDHSAGVDLTLAIPSNKKRKLTPIQQSFLLKEILDAPKSIKPYKRKYPR